VEGGNYTSAAWEKGLLDRKRRRSRKTSDLSLKKNTNAITSSLHSTFRKKGRGTYYQGIRGKEGEGILSKLRNLAYLAQVEGEMPSS